MTNQELTAIFSDALRKFHHNRILRVNAVFYPYKSVKNTIRLSGKAVTARITDRLQSAPRYIIEIAAHLLLSKLYHKRPESRLRKIYNAYCMDAFPHQSNPPTGYLFTGKYVNLKNRFDDLNKKYFDSQLQVNTIGWSKRPSFTRLGFYDHERDLLVISSIFDDQTIPRKVIDYLMFHEMLHVKFPVQSRNGRRIIHSAEFKKAEKRFPDYMQAKNWLDNYLKTRKKRIRFF